MTGLSVPRFKVGASVVVFLAVLRLSCIAFAASSAAVARDLLSTSVRRRDKYGLPLFPLRRFRSSVVLLFLFAAAAAAAQSVSNLLSCWCVGH